MDKKPQKTLILWFDQSAAVYKRVNQLDFMVGPNINSLTWFIFHCEKIHLRISNFSCSAALIDLWIII